MKKLFIAILLLLALASPAISQPFVPALIKVTDGVTTGWVYSLTLPPGGVASISSSNANILSTVTGGAEYNNGTCTTAKTIDPANGNNQKVTLTNAQTCVLTFTQPSSGTVKILLRVIQSAAGSFDGAISGGLWPSAIVPTITRTSGAVDIISCYLNGTSAYCVPSQDFR